MSIYQQVAKRYKIVSEEKAGGATYTPKILSDFVAKKIIEAVQQLKIITDKKPIRVLDPAIGEGELLISLIEQLIKERYQKIEVFGFETDPKAVELATSRLRNLFPEIKFNFKVGNFLDFVLKNFGLNQQYDLFQAAISDRYDLIIANPPYVRTQIMGSARSQLLAQQFGLNGRVDLYFPFILSMSVVLKPQGVAGIITSNRFMTTQSGATIRRAIRERFNIRHIWDLGDTKLFDAAVLPAVLLLEGKNGQKIKIPAFTSIYQTNDKTATYAKDPIDALYKEGIIEIDDGRKFRVQTGNLDTSGKFEGLWRIATTASDGWLLTVQSKTWGTFQSIGKIRVGVKTCADKVFIRSDWQSFPSDELPELLCPLSTHHIARRYKALSDRGKMEILYPHEVAFGKRLAVDLNKYPRSKVYLERNRSILEARKYVVESGREWYEIWVPQDPKAWDQPKLVFRDIVEQPTFWIDKEKSVINGDCYWLVCNHSEQAELLWLALAIGNSTFIEAFYDRCFHNKLYSGRRRFMTQYVEKFPIPDPNKKISQTIIKKAKQIYDCTPSSKAETLEKEVDRLVWQAFDLSFEEIGR